MRNNYYVYGHFDLNGNLFYIGKGTGKRAFKKSINERSNIWSYYVSKHLNGKFEALILKDNLTEDEAEYLEYETLKVLGFNTVNWINPQRTCNLELNQKYHYLLGKNKKLIADSISIEKININKAIEGYKEAINSLPTYNTLPFDWLGETPALVDKLYIEMGGGRKEGEIKAIERLTICLCKKGLRLEAKQAAIKYFEDYPPTNFYRKKYITIMKRVFKGDEIPLEVINNFNNKDGFDETWAWRYNI